MRAILLPALRVTLVTWVLCGIIYPLAVTGLGQWLLPDQANGSLLRKTDGTVIGSRLIGQDWTGPEWFHGRPSATITADPSEPNKTISAPYNAAASGGSNLGPTSRALADRLASADRFGFRPRSGYQPGVRHAAGSASCGCARYLKR
jgi:potassium-transporting ATPase KdpC subunit